MSIYEYDQEEHIRLEREEAFEDGRVEGRIEGERARLLAQVKKKLSKNKSVKVIAEELEESIEAIEGAGL